MDWSGRKIVYETDQPLESGDGNDQPDAYLFDLDQRSIARLSEAADGSDGVGGSTDPTISGDGSTIAFVSADINLDLAEPDIGGYVDVHVRSLRDRLAARRLSKTRQGGQANSDSQRPAMNYNGTKLVFDSDADNLDDNGSNGFLNVFGRANPLDEFTLLRTGFE